MLASVLFSCSVVVLVKFAISSGGQATALSESGYATTREDAPMRLKK